MDYLQYLKDKLKHEIYIHRYLGDMPIKDEFWSSAFIKFSARISLLEELIYEFENQEDKWS